MRDTNTAISGSTLLIACVLLVASLVNAIFIGERDDCLFQSQLYILAAGASWLQCLTSSNRGGVSFMVNFFYLFFIAIPTYFQLAANAFPWGAEFDGVEIGKAYLVISSSHLLYLVGERLVKPLRNQPVLNYVNRQQNEIYLSWGIGFGFFALVLFPAIGFDVLFASRGDVGQMDLETSSIKSQLLSISRSLSLLSFVITFRLFLEDFADRRRAFVTIAMMGTGLVFFVANFPPGLPRFTLLGSALAISVIQLFF